MIAHDRLEQDTTRPDDTSHSPEDRTNALRTALNEARRWLPHQGPIGVFVHQNTLEHLEDRPFHDAVVEAHLRLGTEPYWTESAYRDGFRRGRINAEDLAWACDAVLDHRRSRKRRLCSGRLSLEELRVLALHHDLEAPSAAAARFMLNDGILPGPIAEACLKRVARAPAVPPSQVRPRPLRRHRDLCVEAGCEDPDARVHEALIPVLAAYCDRGVAIRRWPDQAGSLYTSLRELWTECPPRSFGRPLSDELAEQARTRMSSSQVAIRMLDALGVPAKEWAPFLTASLLALPGWSGLVQWLASHGHISGAAEDSLLDLVAIRLTLDVLALEASLAAARAFTPDTPTRLFDRLQDERDQVAGEAAAAGRAVQLARLAMLCGFDPPEIEALPENDLRRLFQALDHFDPLTRRRIWHEAYERHYRREILLAIRAKSRETDDTPMAPRAQVAVCIDEREESFRRHIEECGPDIETVGTAGFFGLAIDYRGLEDHDYAPLCPIVISPEHAIEERAHEEDVHVLGQRRRLLGIWHRGLHHGRTAAHSYALSGVTTAILGWFAALPLFLSVLMPHVAERLARAASRALTPKPRTRLARTYAGDTSAHGKPVGFLIDEQADRVLGMLRGSGLLGRLAPLVVILGHGSTSMNNPHESAHDCGACGGRQGGANARLLAEMANDREVRANLRDRGLPIPDATWFVGGLHDTCSDRVVLYDVDQTPETHRTELDSIARLLDEARARNAHERCRRFDFAPRGDSLERALRHVERRAHALDEPRPEYGHATNALCIVGRRNLTRRLFLDRRAFLTSYDPDQDPEGTQLAATLGAVVPVCGGINLEYYFSFVDNEAYGCGTKLPHNITGLVGVMNGHRSDLRTGLPWQMVEIHEPVRLLFVIEARPETISAIARQNAQIGRLFFNGWVQVASVDPHTGRIFELVGENWIPLDEAPIRLLHASSSLEWYRGRRDALAPACVGSVRPAPAPRLLQGAVA